MNDEQEMPETLEEMVIKAIAKFRRLSSEGRKKFLAKVDVIITNEPDAEIAALLGGLKAEFKKEGAK